ncbi:sulfatase-like hydrolase/transferase [Pelagicoccus sp. SDUM812005]|uniref:sulfatase-like hydrolase/transferase n=1 Tax=Pelagicoccus sp. SDUM812005 TaxID=3041257 RepID=UPI00280DDDCA|nr:sulfatase-like hydrolase/transferase [Pelagicoccus sp. SDUM812005]MDQ8183136.1 sulfatase-like hydrolase/transferase [Pelagicoccus sp. SDUM812005]
MKAIHLAAAVVSFALSSSGLPAVHAAQAAKPKNIVFILADDLSWIDVSTGNSNQGRGSQYFETPNIDRLASQSRSFTHAYTQQNCAPTRAALISGQYATGPNNGVYNVGSLARQNKQTEGYPKLPIKAAEQRKNIPDKGVSIFNMAQSAGLHTCLIGKSHGTPNPLEGGYGLDLPAYVHHILHGTVDGKKVTNQHYMALKDDERGWTFLSNYVDRYAAPYDRGYIESKLAPFQNQNDLSLLLGTPKHLTDAIGDFSTDYIKERAAEETPFFLYVPFHAIHTDIVGRKDYVAKYAARGFDAQQAEYAALVELLDQNVGRILQSLKDPNGDGNFDDDLSADTLVIFTSDNGGLRSNTPLTGRKGHLYEGGIRVPLMIRWPAVIEPNSVSNQAVHSIDFYPTFAELLGVDVSDRQLDGVSIASILKGEATRLERENLFWHFPGYMDFRTRPSTVVQRRVGDQYYKLFYYYETGKWELFHLNEDISEQNDLLAHRLPEQLTGLLKSMKRDMRDWLVATQAPTGTWIESGKPVDYPRADQ